MTPRYGIDAPTVVRNLAIASGALLALATVIRRGWALSFLHPLTPTMIGTGVSCGVMSLWPGARS